MMVIDKKNILEEYRNVVATDSVKARKLIRKLDYKNDYYLLRCIAQTYMDESRFEDDEGSNLREYLNMRKLRMAEQYIIKAFTINSDSAEVLYTMGEVRKLYGQKDVAIYCFDKLIQLGVKRVAYSENGRGISFAKELINDSRFELYRLHYEDNSTLSKRYLSAYKKGIEAGVTTIFKPLERFLLE